VVLAERVYNLKPEATPEASVGSERPCSMRKGVSMTTYQVGYFVGSLSSKSINRILSKALIRLAPDDL